MENASKALIMAASILIGVMIMSIGVALFNSFSDFSRTNIEKMDEKKLAEWNNNFLKYYGSNMVDVTKEINGRNVVVGEKEETIRVTAHDIISVANLAKENNKAYELEDTREANENIYYIQVCLKNYGNDRSYYRHLESEKEEDKIEFLKLNKLMENDTETKYYKCSNVEISKVTKRVIKIEFEEYK